MGFFSDAYYAMRSPRVPLWVRAELAQELEWFGYYLDVPCVLARQTGRHRLFHGVCWFRDRAQAHVSHARYTCWLLEELGLPITEWRVDEPGTVIWGDDHQVVALNDRRGPDRLN